MPAKNAVSYNSIITACVQNDMLHDAFTYFLSMPEKNVASYNVMISGFVKSGLMREAQKLFEEMPRPNDVSYTMMIDGYTKMEGGIQRARALFDAMPRRNAVTWSVMISGLVENGFCEEAWELFERMPQKNVISITAMITGFCKEGMKEEAMTLFKHIRCRDSISWNIMIKVLIKWKRLLTTASLKQLSFTATFIACLPSMVQQIKSPSNRGFLYGMLNSSFSFYLFSFQVHEKSVLLPLLPASLLAMEVPSIFWWLMQFVMLSMFPLLYRDNLVVPYLALLALFTLIFNAPGQNRVRENNYFHYYLDTTTMRLVLCCYIMLHIVYLTMHPPEKYPFLFEAVIMNLCFSQFVLVTLGSNIKQWMLNKPVKLEIDKKLI